MQEKQSLKSDRPLQGKEKFSSVLPEEQHALPNRTRGVRKSEATSITSKAMWYQSPLEVSARRTARESDLKKFSMNSKEELLNYLSYSSSSEWDSVLEQVQTSNGTSAGLSVWALTGILAI